MAKRIGRDRQREAYWRPVVRGQRGSGLSVGDFCRKSKLPESAFYFWRREPQRRQAEHLSGAASAKPEEQGGCAGRPAGGAAKVVFLPVNVTEEAPSPGGRIEIELAGGRRVRRGWEGV